MRQEETIELMIQKNEKALIKFYETYSKSLFSVISVHINNNDEAQKILQEVFVKIWNTIDSFPQSNLRLFTWIVKITREEAILNASQNSLSATTSFIEIHSKSDKTTFKAESIGLQEFTKKLKPKCIQIIDQLFYQGHAELETSKKMEIPVNTVKSHNRICISEIRTYLKN